MNKRIAKKYAKRVGQSMSDAFSLGTILSHARPSFWAVRPYGLQREMIAEQAAKLGLRYRAAKRVAKSFDPHGAEAIWSLAASNQALLVYSAGEHSKR